ncbi:MAG: hypothetical protein ACRENP_21995 [Longimicrobiales bacterium]
MSDLPIGIACSLPREQWPERAEALAAVFHSARTVRQEFGGLRLDFPASAEMARALLELVLSERECCAFLSFQLEMGPGPDVLRLQVRSPAGEAAVEAWLRVIQPAAEISDT